MTQRLATLVLKIGTFRVHWHMHNIEPSMFSAVDRGLNQQYIKSRSHTPASDRQATAR